MTYSTFTVHILFFSFVLFSFLFAKLGFLHLCIAYLHVICHRTLRQALDLRASVTDWRIIRSKMSNHLDYEGVSHVLSNGLAQLYPHDLGRGEMIKSK
jgi:hypothetical protein